MSAISDYNNNSPEGVSPVSYVSLPSARPAPEKRTVQVLVQKGEEGSKPLDPARVAVVDQPEEDEICSFSTRAIRWMNKEDWSCLVKYGLMKNPIFRVIGLTVAAVAGFFVHGVKAFYHLGLGLVGGIVWLVPNFFSAIFRWKRIECMDGVAEFALRHLGDGLLHTGSSLSDGYRALPFLGTIPALIHSYACPENFRKDAETPAVCIEALCWPGFPIALCMLFASGN